MDENPYKAPVCSAKLAARLKPPRKRLPLRACVMPTLFLISATFIAFQGIAFSIGTARAVAENAADLGAALEPVLTMGTLAIVQLALSVTIVWCVRRMVRDARRRHQNAA